MRGLLIITISFLSNLMGDLFFIKTYPQFPDIKLMYSTSDGSICVCDGSNLAKLNPEDGSIITAKTYGVPISGSPTNDGGYIAKGTIYSGGYISSAVIIKLNSDLDVIWAKELPMDLSTDIEILQTMDDGYIIGSSTANTGLLVFIKLTSEGDIEWAKKISLPILDYVTSLTETNDGYIATTYHNSAIIKLDFSGNVVWCKDVSGYHHLPAGQKTSDGGYILGGYIFMDMYNMDGLVTKLNSNFEVEWARRIPIENDYILEVKQTLDGGYLAVGYSGPYTIPAIYYGMLVVKLDQNGEMVWARKFDIPYNDMANSITETNNAYLIGGNSAQGGVLIKTTKNGDISPDCPWYTISPALYSQDITLSSLSYNVENVNISTSPYSISVSPFYVDVYDLCSSLGEDDDTFYSPKRDSIFSNIRIKSFTFINDKISLKLLGYKDGKIKIGLYNISGNEIISKRLEFKNCIEIKDKKIEKLSKGTYFLKIYVDEKEIGKVKIIK